MESVSEAVAPPEAKAISSPIESSEKQRAKQAVAFAGELASLVESARTQSQHIEEGRGYVDRIRSELDTNANEAKRVASEITSLNSRSSELRTQVEADAAKIVECRSKSESDATMIATLAERATKGEEESTRRFSEMSQKLTAFEQQFETQKGRIDTLIAEQQTQFSTRLSTFESQVSEQKNRLETLHNEQQLLFTQRSDERGTKFNEQCARFEQSEAARTKRSGDQLTELRTEFATLSKQTTDSAQRLMSEEGERFRVFLQKSEQEAEVSLRALQARLDEAVRIVGLIGNTGLTGNYQRVANQESVVANRFRWIAIACMVAMVLCVLWIVAHVNRADFDWEVALFRLAAAIVCLAPGWYCAKESGRHRRVAERNRRIELELASLSPYLAELPDAERLKIVGELSHQYFGGEIDEKEGSASKETKWLRTGDFVKLLDQINKLRK